MGDKLNHDEIKVWEQVMVSSIAVFLESPSRWKGIQTTQDAVDTAAFIADAVIEKRRAIVENSNEGPYR